jgi:hypothetical protein
VINDRMPRETHEQTIRTSDSGDAVIGTLRFEATGQSRFSTFQSQPASVA